METMIVVMMLWAGSSHGGPATIQGFRTMEACERAKPAIMKTYEDLQLSGYSNRGQVSIGMKAVCRQINLTSGLVEGPSIPNVPPNN